MQSLSVEDQAWSGPSGRGNWIERKTQDSVSVHPGLRSLSPSGSPPQWAGEGAGGCATFFCLLAFLHDQIAGEFEMHNGLGGNNEIAIAGEACCRGAGAAARQAADQHAFRSACQTAQEHAQP